MKKASISIILLFFVCYMQAEDGYELWLRYKPLADKNLFATYQRQLKVIAFYGTSPTLNAAKKRVTGWLTRTPWKSCSVYCKI